MAPNVDPRYHNGMTAGELILMARRRAQLSQRELAERIACRQATIARWERGDRLASYEDVQQAAAACGLALDIRLAREDRSWWPQIAEQLDAGPTERVRRLTPAGSADVMPVLRALAEAQARAIVIGEVAGALQGWPLVLGGDVVEVCARAGDDALNAALEVLEVRERADGVYECSGGVHLITRDAPPGTSGHRDLARGVDLIDIDGGTLPTAGLLDLLRIADASADPDARRHGLALRSVLDVQRAQRASRTTDHPSDEERLQQWLDHQTPVA